MKGFFIAIACIFIVLAVLSTDYRNAVEVQATLVEMNRSTFAELEAKTDAATVDRVKAEWHRVFPEPDAESAALLRNTVSSIPRGSSINDARTNGPILRALSDALDRPRQEAAARKAVGEARGILDTPLRLALILALPFVLFVAFRASRRR